MSVTIEQIQAAAARIESRIHRTPIVSSQYFDQLTRRRVHFKSEHLQKTGSFKARGALNATLQLTSGCQSVCCDSSGNHGQALSWAANQAGVVCHVAVPEGAPAVKVAAIESYKGNVHYCPSNDAGRVAKRDELERVYGAEMIHPSQDHRVIAGQGTIGLELAEQLDELDCVIVPVGGGGLISGIATALKSLKPGVKVIGAEPVAVDDCKQSFDAQQLLVTQKKYTVCDGVRTNVGANTFPIITELVDDIFTVNDEQVGRSWCDIMERMKTVIEPTGALATAVLTSEAFNAAYPAESYPNVAVILCGGNLDLAMVAKMVELGQARATN